MMKKVLAIDDSPVLCALYKFSLKKHFEIEIEMDGALGIDKALSSIYDLVITDYNLPGMTGLEIIQKLRVNSRYVDVPIIIISTDLESIKAARSAGADAFLLKPILPNKLLLAAKVLTSGQYVRPN